MATKRVEVIFDGRVHGVGFRYTVSSLAERFQVVGTVRNLHDGTVELIAEGDEAEVRRFVDAVSRSMARYITSAREQWSEPTGAFKGFRIAF